MGVHFDAAGLAYEDSYDCGYITYGQYRIALAKAIDPEFGFLYEGWYGSYCHEEDGSWVHEVMLHARGPAELEFILALPLIENVQVRGDRFMRSMTQEEWDRLDEGFVRKKQATVEADMRRDDFCKLVDERVSETAQNLLFAPDSEGKWSWKECRDMYKELSGYEVGTLGHNYGEVVRGGEMRTYNMHEQFMGMTRHCWKRRVNLWWR